jgi:DNA-binding HxlR family transcriptional regulator
MVAFKRSPCPIASALDILGDRWSLVVVRDLLFRDRHTYGELLDAPEGISTNILAERLRRLEEAGIITKETYQTRPRRYRYRLTEKGEALRPVLVSMVRWANMHIPGTARPPVT